MDCDARQQILDEEHLRLLRIGYFVMGGTAAFTGLFGLLYAGMGAFFMAAFHSMPANARQAPPEFMGLLFMAIGGFIVLGLGFYAALALLTARALKRRQGRTLCLATAALSCLYIPFGTVLGIFTFSVLNRHSVQSCFGGAPPPWQPAAPVPQPPIPTPLPSQPPDTAV